MYWPKLYEKPLELSEPCVILKVALTGPGVCGVQTIAVGEELRGNGEPEKVPPHWYVFPVCAIVQVSNANQISGVEEGAIQSNLQLVRLFPASSTQFAVVLVPLMKL